MPACNKKTQGVSTHDSLQKLCANVNLLGSSISSVGRQRQSPQTGRRRSTVLMNLQLNDPSLPGPGEMVNEPHPTLLRTASPQSISGSPNLPARDPHHLRNPSLGEIHQELEQEQEAQVVSHTPFGHADVAVAVYIHHQEIMLIRDRTAFYR